MNARKDRFHQIVGERIREVRKESGLSIEKLASVSHINRSTIDNAEQGLAIGLYTLALIAEGLDVSLDELVPIEALMVARDEAAE